MINLRYHIVSLTAVFLAIGIGLTLGSTFLDRATVDNLQGRLGDLATRLEEREQQVNELEGQLDDDRAVRAALDEQATGLLAGRLEGVPVAVVASRGADEADVEAAQQALVAAGGDAQGVFWFTDRWALDDAGEVDDLAAVVEEDTDDPSRLRRMAINLLADLLLERQVLEVATGDPTDPADPSAPGDGTGTDAEPTTGEDGAAAPGATGEEVDGVGDADEVTDIAAGPGQTDDPTDDPVDEPDDDSSIALVTALVETGFIEFDPVPGGPELPEVPAGTRLVLVGGSPEVADDLVIEPLVARLGAGANPDAPVLAVATSARAEDGDISDLVTVIRESDELRELIATVDDVEHFDGWAAMVLALAEVGDGVVGHYGVAEGASRLLPPLPAP